MTLQSDLTLAFSRWHPSPPTVEGRSTRDVTLSWHQPELMFLEGELLYRLERKEKMPAWVVVYSGGKSTKRIDNLAPCSPHRFRLRVIVKATAVPTLAQRATEYYGDEEATYEALGDDLLKDINHKREEVVDNASVVGDKSVGSVGDSAGFDDRTQDQRRPNKWLESEWSEELCTSTASEGTSATCFCMAVQGGYLKQVQLLLEERPALVDIVNPTSGYTPLATAVIKGDLHMVKCLLSSGAGLHQPSCGGRTPLHLAALHRHLGLFDLLLEKGADFQARDINDLRVEHFAVDSGDVAIVSHIISRGGDVTVRDNNGWTPLFRAVCQDASTAIIQELVRRGSELDVKDAAGMLLAAAASLLTDRHGRPREPVLRLVDPQYPRVKAIANFTRLTHKIASVRSMLRH